MAAWPSEAQATLSWPDSTYILCFHIIADRRCRVRFSLTFCLLTYSLTPLRASLVDVLIGRLEGLLYPYMIFMGLCQ